MKMIIQMVGWFLSPLVLIGWIYGLAKVGVYFWGWRLDVAIGAAVIVTAIQGSTMFAAGAAGLISDEPGEKK